MVPAGTYDVSVPNAYWNDLTTGQRQNALLVEPEVTVPEQSEVVLDAAAAKPITFDTPQPYGAEGIRGETSFTFQYLRLGPDGQPAAGWAGFAAEPLQWATPTEPLSLGSLEYAPRFGFAAPPVTMSAVAGGLNRQLQVTYAEKWTDTGPISPRGPAEMFPEGTQTLPLVDAGTGTAKELDGLDVRGKLVLLNRDPAEVDPDGGVEGCWPTQEAFDRVAAGKPAGVIAVQNTQAAPPFDPWIQGGCALPDITNFDPGVPLVFAPITDAQYLRSLLANRTVNIRVHGTPVTPYFYDLKPYFEGRIPDTLHIDVNGRLAELHHAYHADRGEMYAHAWRRNPNFVYPSLGGQRVILGGHQILGQTPREITHYLGPTDPDVVWEIDADDVAGEEDTLPRASTGFVFDEPVQEQLGWYDSPQVPATDPAMPHWPGQGPEVPCTGCREADGIFWTRLPYTASSNPDQQGSEAVGGIFTADPNLHLYRDGNEVPQTFVHVNLPGFGSVPFAVYKLAPEAATYELTHDFHGTHTAWKFASTPATTMQAAEPYRCGIAQYQELGGGPPSKDARCAPQPLIFLRYNFGLDLHNQVRVPGKHQFEVTAYRQPSLVEMPPIAGMRVWTSVDAGEQWKEARVTPQGGRLGEGTFQVTTSYPKLANTDGTVALKVEAWDVDGNRITQRINNAFGLSQR